MSEFCRLAKMILRTTFLERHRGHSELARLLVRHCPGEASFQGVENAVLVNLPRGPGTVPP